MGDPRRVGQLLAFPLVAFGALVRLVSLPYRLQSGAPILLIVIVALLIEAGVAFLCALALRGRLKDRLSYSPFVVALASSVGLLAATLLAGALAAPVLSAGRMALKPELIPIAAVFLGLGSGLGTVCGCRYHPD